jgi:hypothetical protein
LSMLSVSGALSISILALSNTPRAAPKWPCVGCRKIGWDDYICCCCFVVAMF